MQRRRRPEGCRGAPHPCVHAFMRRPGRRPVRIVVGFPPAAHRGWTEWSVRSSAYENRSSSRRGAVAACSRATYRDQPSDQRVL